MASCIRATRLRKLPDSTTGSIQSPNLRRRRSRKMTTFLDRDEIVSLTDARRKATQIRVLEANRIAFFLNASGWPVSFCSTRNSLFYKSVQERRPHHRGQGQRTHRVSVGVVLVENQIRDLAHTRSEQAAEDPALGCIHTNLPVAQDP
jgi:hypothetical protein